jgi:hypothetical protein
MTWEEYEKRYVTQPQRIKTVEEMAEETIRAFAEAMRKAFDNANN